jgi:hypothetical protein
VRVTFNELAERELNDAAQYYVHVQIEPRPCTFCSCDRFLSLPPTNDPISSHCSHLQDRFRIVSTAVFLAYDESAWLTGEGLLATGGIR